MKKNEHLKLYQYCLLIMLMSFCVFPSRAQSYDYKMLIQMGDHKSQDKTYRVTFFKNLKTSGNIYIGAIGSAGYDTATIQRVLFSGDKFVIKNEKDGIVENVDSYFFWIEKNWLEVYDQDLNLISGFNPGKDCGSPSLIDGDDPILRVISKDWIYMFCNQSSIFNNYGEKILTVESLKSWDEVKRCGKDTFLFYNSHIIGPDYPITLLDLKNRRILLSINPSMDPNGSNQVYFSRSTGTMFISTYLPFEGGPGILHVFNSDGSLKFKSPDVKNWIDRFEPVEADGYIYLYSNEDKKFLKLSSKTGEKIGEQYIGKLFHSLDFEWDNASAMKILHGNAIMLLESNSLQISGEKKSEHYAVLLDSDMKPVSWTRLNNYPSTDDHWTDLLMQLKATK
jgi:hypothetical protein